VGDRNERREPSVVLPDLDLLEMARHIDPENQTEAVARFRASLRRRSA